MVFVALDEACEQEVVGQNAHRITSPPPLLYVNCLSRGAPKSFSRNENRVFSHSSDTLLASDTLGAPLPMGEELVTTVHQNITVHTDPPLGGIHYA